MFAFGALEVSFSKQKNLAFVLKRRVMRQTCKKVGGGPFAKFSVLFFLGRIIVKLQKYSFSLFFV